MSNTQKNIQIAVRIKPFSPLITTNIKWDNYKILVQQKNSFTFDYVLDPYASQQKVFQKIGFKIISNVLQGYNGCIFAYGQTGSGKTYTMTGDNNQEGLIQKCLKTLWNCVNQSEYSQIKLSYFEIYNETIKDLLSDKQNLNIREHMKNGFYIQNLTQHTIFAYQQFQELINQGLIARSVKQTKMNSVSSRSHSILDIKIVYKRKNNQGLFLTRQSKLSFIDLAGSQKQKQTLVEGERLKQAANINKSLSTLSLVIAKLSQQSQKKGGSSIHIPYRNSVLTKILKNNLAGKSKILIVCTISIQNKYIDQTQSTLRFAQTAKNIKLKVKKNQQQIDGQKQRLTNELNDLKKLYEQLKEKFEQKKSQCQQLKLRNAQLLDQVQIKNYALNQIEINYACSQMQNQRIVQSLSEQINMSQNGYFSQQFNAGIESSFLDSIYSIQSNQQSKQKQCYTIVQAQQKQQQDVSVIKQNFKKIISDLKQSKSKIQIQNEFLKYQNQILQEENQQLLKKIVYMEQSTQAMQKYMGLIRQAMSTFNFDYAQKIFLKSCIQHVKRYENEKQIAEQQTIKHKNKYNTTLQKVKKILQIYFSSNSINNLPNFDVLSSNNFENVRQQINCYQSQTQENLNLTQMKKQKQRINYFSNQKINQNSTQNFKPWNLSQNTHTFFGKGILSQSLLSSKGSSKFANNQLQILKEDIQKLKLQIKQKNQQLDRIKIKNMQNQFKIQQKLIENENYQIKINQMLEQINKKSQQIFQQRQKNKQLEKNNKIILNLNEQLTLLKRYINQKDIHFSMINNQLNLKIKQLELSLKSTKIKNTQLSQQKRSQIQSCLALKKQYQNIIDTLNNQKEQIERQNAMLNSQNKILSQDNEQFKDKINNLIEVINQLLNDKKVQKQSVLLNKKLLNINQILKLQPSQKQYRQIIQKNKLQKIHKAAYFYFRKSFTLEQKIQFYQKKTKQMQEQINSLKNQLKEYLILKNKIIKSQGRSWQSQFQKANLQQQNQNLKTIIDQSKNHSRELQLKLKQKQQSEFEIKQKYNQNIQFYEIKKSIKNQSFLRKNNHNEQIDNSYLTPQNSIIKSQYDSPSLSSQKTIKNISGRINYHNLIENRREQQNDKNQVMQIEQRFSQQNSSKNLIKQQIQQNGSFFNETLTNINLRKNKIWNNYQPSKDYEQIQFKSFDEQQFNQYNSKLKQLINQNQSISKSDLLKNNSNRLSFKFNSKK